MDNPVLTTEFKLTQAQESAMRVLGTDARHVCLEGGSRSGKTFLFVRALIVRGLKEPRTRHAALRFRQNAAIANLVKQTLPDVMEKAFPGLMEQCNYNGEFNVLTLPNKSEIWFIGLDDKDRVEKALGSEYSTLYFNECSQIPWYSRNVMMSRLAQKSNLTLKAYYDLNPDNTASWVYKLFHLKKDPVSGVSTAKPEMYSTYKLNPQDNRANLADDYIQTLEELPERERRRFLLGLYGDATDGALWTHNLISIHRVSETPAMQRVVVAVDPSGGAGGDDSSNDEVGIGVCGLGVDGLGYIIEDLSGKYHPREWSGIVSSAYERNGADSVVAEGNYGGAMVEAVIETDDLPMAFKMVTATRGKHIRAEPIAALYEKGKVKHAGVFPELENQMVDFTLSGYKGTGSPDRVDWLVWGLTALFKDITKAKGSAEFQHTPRVNFQKRSMTQYAKRLR